MGNFSKQMEKHLHLHHLLLFLVLIWLFFLAFFYFLTRGIEVSTVSWDKSVEPWLHRQNMLQTMKKTSCRGGLCSVANWQNATWDKSVLLLFSELEKKIFIFTVYLYDCCLCVCLCITLLCAVYLACFPADSSHPTMSRLWGDGRRCRCDHRVRVCACVNALVCAVANTAALSCRNGGSDRCLTAPLVSAVPTQTWNRADEMCKIKWRLLFCLLSVSSSRHPLFSFLFDPLPLF